MLDGKGELSEKTRGKSPRPTPRPGMNYSYKTVRLIISLTQLSAKITLELSVYLFIKSCDESASYPLLIASCHPLCEDHIR